MRLFLSFFLCFHFTSTRAEHWPTLGLDELYIESTDVFIVKPITFTMVGNFTIGRTYNFKYLIINVIKSNTLSSVDTLNATINGYAFDDLFEQFGKVDTFLIFGNWFNSEFIPTLSGIRAFKNDLLFLPIQQETTGGFDFLPFPKINYNDNLSHIHKVKIRVDSLLILLKIPDLKQQNQALFHWIEQHRSDLISQDFKDNSTRWFSLSEKVFEWINCNGIWKDTWKSLLLSRVILGHFAHEPYYESKKAFISPEARDFLMKIIENDSVFENRILAFQILPNCLCIYENQDYQTIKNPIIVADSNQINTLEQQKILNFANKYLKDDFLKNDALKLIESAYYPWESIEINLYNFSLLPELALLLTQTTETDFKFHLSNLIEDMKNKQSMIEYYKSKKTKF
jgi:hypothetical protein